MDKPCAAMPVHALLPLLRGGRLTCAELARACLARIDAIDGIVHAFTDVYARQALAQAAEADRRRAAGEALSPWDGIPIAVKANIAIAGERHTCGSRCLERYVSPYSASVIERVQAAGLVILGQTNMDEFAMGGGTEYSAFGPTRNPLMPARTPGGSSGGSAAAVAAGMVPWALGSDTGGSIRQPAAYCGVCGLKPAYGAVSRYGLAAFASSMDCIGPITRDAEDAALLLGLLMGPDARDATCAGWPLGSISPVSDWRGVTLGIWMGERRDLSEPDPTGDGADGTDARGAAAYVAGALIGLGATVMPAPLPASADALPIYYTLASAEAGSNLARYDGVRYGLRAEGDGGLADLYARSRSEGFGPEVRRRVLMSAYALKSDQRGESYQRARDARDRLTEELARVLTRCDALLCPTTPTTAYLLGRRRNDPTRSYRDDAFTVPFSLAGLPAISLPLGVGADGMPVGVQLAGARDGTERLLELAVGIERALGRR